MSEWSLNIHIGRHWDRQECCLPDLSCNLVGVSKVVFGWTGLCVPSYLDTNVKGSEEFEFWKYEPPS